MLQVPRQVDTVTQSELGREGRMKENELKEEKICCRYLGRQVDTVTQSEYETQVDRERQAMQK